MVVALAAILAGVVIVASGRGGEMARFANDYAPLEFGSLTATDVALFRPPSALWGYHMQATDEALGGIASALSVRDSRIAALERQVALLRAGQDTRPETGRPAGSAEPLGQARRAGPPEPAADVQPGGQERPPQAGWPDGEGWPSAEPGQGGDPWFAALDRPAASGPAPSGGPASTDRPGAGWPGGYRDVISAGGYRADGLGWPAAGDETPAGDEPR
jgi:hypothetical protein